MSVDSNRILDGLGRVEAQRRRRMAEPSLMARVSAIKMFQSRRFSKTYADLLSDARYAAAARFFLDELYGPYDFSTRDAQFARIVPALVRLFPREIVETVSVLATLHALSEELDTEMALAWPDAGTEPRFYVEAWQRVGRRADRMEQIALMYSVGRALDGYTGNPLLRHSLRLMRAPAKAAGLGALQHFLESGFDTFRAMRGAEPFLRTIAERETGLCGRMFAVSIDDASALAEVLLELP